MFAVFACLFLVLNRYHDQLVATEAKFPIAENQVIVTCVLVTNRNRVTGL